MREEWKVDEVDVKMIFFALNNASKNAFAVIEKANSSFNFAPTIIFNDLGEVIR